MTNKNQATYDAAVKKLEAHLNNYCNENGYVEGDTNAYIPNNSHVETYIGAVESCIEILGKK